VSKIDAAMGRLCACVPPVRLRAAVGACVPPVRLRAACAPACVSETLKLRARKS